MTVPDGRESTRNALIVLLAINSGATDAIGFLALGGAFTSVMTGNMVLLGVSAAQADAALAANTAAAIVCFVLGCVVGTRVAGTARADDPPWPGEVSRALAVEFAVLAAYAVGWWASGGEPNGRVQLVLLVANALALGIQSSAIQRFGVPGLSTTYLTGTLTTVVIRLCSGHRLREVAPSARILLGLVVGAAAGGMLALHAPTAAPLLQLASVLAVVATASLRPRRVGSRPARVGQ